jgi:hypothetical protein
MVWTDILTAGVQHEVYVRWWPGCEISTWRNYGRSRTIVDLGPVSARAVVRAARADPRVLAIAVDSDASGLHDVSRRAARPIRKGGLPNALFLVADAPKPACFPNTQPRLKSDGASRQNMHQQPRRDGRCAAWAGSLKQVHKVAPSLARRGVHLEAHSGAVDGKRGCCRSSPPVGQHID